MKVAIAGAGNVGQFIANDLAMAGHEVLILEQDPGVVSRSAPTLSGPRGEGGSIDWRTVDACEVTSLREADIASVDVVVAATGDDEDNLVISLLAKQEYSVPRVLARVNHPKNEWLFTDQWGVDAAVSPPHILTSLVEEAISVGDIIRILPLERGRAGLVELRLPEDSATDGHPLYELRLPPDSAIVAILREGHVVIPQPETVLTRGDEIVALVAPEAEEALRQAITGAA